jgi:hypothetical protein
MYYVILLLCLIFEKVRLKRPKLIPNAVPSIFPNIPSHYIPYSVRSKQNPRKPKARGNTAEPPTMSVGKITCKKVIRSHFWKCNSNPGHLYLGNYTRIVPTNVITSYR